MYEEFPKLSAMARAVHTCTSTYQRGDRARRTGVTSGIDGYSAQLGLGLGPNVSAGAMPYLL
jgi:hypothetical protein